VTTNRTPATTSAASLLRHLLPALRALAHRVLIDAMTGMAHGLFASLILGTILGQLGRLLPGAADGRFPWTTFAANALGALVGDEHIGLLQQLANDRIPVRLHGFLGIHGKDQRGATARAAACLDQVDTVVGDLLHGLDDDVLMEQPCGSGFAGHRFLWRKLKRPWEGLDGYRPLRPARGRTGLRDVFRPFLAAGAGLSDCPNLSCLPRPDHPQM